MIVDCAHYTKDGRRDSGKLDVCEAADRAQSDNGFVWLGLYEPSPEEMESIAAEFGLHELAVEDAQHAHQRPKVEDYDASYFVVLKTARYDEAKEEVEFGEIHLFLGSGYAIVVRHGEASELSRARRRLEDRPDLLDEGPAAVVWAVLDTVVDDYLPVISGLDDDVQEVEEAVFAGTADQTTRAYFLKRELLEFHRAVHPLLAPLQTLEEGRLAEPESDLPRYFRDVNDHAKRIDEEIHTLRELLNSIFQANLARVAVEQNAVVRTVSAWAAIITVPTLIASIYGMNFERMPELGWYVGYPLALLLMLSAAVGLYAYFKRSGWL